jgi:lactate dehydrogenase-like 2-hydroxyacid dehydrogenase
MNIQIGLIGVGRMGKVLAHILAFHVTVPYYMERFGETHAVEISDFMAGILEDHPPSVIG